MAFFDVNSTTSSEKPVMVYTADDSVIVAYRNLNGSTYETTACVLDDGGGAFSCTVLDTDTGYPSIAANPSTDNTVIVVYPLLVSGIYELYYRISTDNGDSWDSVTAITSSSSYDCWNPTVQIDDSGNIVIVYESRDSELVYRLYQIYSLDGGTTWSTPATLTSVTSVTEDVDADNNIGNGDFENWTAGDPDDWGELGTAVTTEEITIVHSGTSSLKLTSAGDPSSDYVWQNIAPVVSGTDCSYLLRGWFYAVSGTGNVEFRTPHYEEIVRTTQEVNRWEPWEFIFQTNPFNVTGLLKLYNGSASDLAYYDDIELKKLTSTTTREHTPVLNLDSDDFEMGHANVLYIDEDDGGGFSIRLHSATGEGGTNITNDVRTLRVSRDKEFKTGVYGAGDFSVVLDNTAQIYTNEKVTSPFYKRLKSGLEVTVQLGVRAYDGSGDLYDSSNWTTELFDSIVGVASKFSINARNNTFTMSGRDRADKFMSYRNFTSELYETQTALQIIQSLANSDTDGDGFGNIDPNRPAIDIELGAKQQTLAAWDDKLISSQSISTGDAGSVQLTKTVHKTIDIITYQANASACVGAWVDRGDSEQPLYTISTRPSGAGLEEIELHKWTGWNNANSTLSHSASWDIIAEFGSTNKVTGGTISVSPYDDYHDCVWIQYGEEWSTGDAYRLRIYHFDFKTQTATLKLTAFTDATGTNFANTKAGAIFYDANNSKLWFANMHERSISGTGTNWPRYGVASVGGTQTVPTLTLDFYDDMQDDSDATATTGNPETYFPSAGINLGPYNYYILGYQYDDGTPINYSSFAAIRSSDVNSYSQTKFSTQFHVNTALCWVTHPTGASPAPVWSSTYKDLATGEAFFDNSSSQRTAQISIDYDDNFVYMFTSDDQTDDWEFKGIANGIQVRRLASRKYNLSRTNVQSTEHTIANGYLDDDTDTIWFSTESIYVENLANTAAADLNEDPEYVDNQWTLSGTGILVPSGTGLAFRNVPVDDYEIHLETGELLFKHLYDKENSIYAGYDYKHAAPYAWFEDVSIWDAIQEVSSSGDFVCYINESGNLVFKDRFVYHQPRESEYQAFLNAGSPGAWTNTPFQISDLDGNDVTNIIPGLEFVTSVDPDTATGEFFIYRRRSYTTNGVTTIGEEGDYDIDYDTGEIGFNSSGDIPGGSRVLLYYYNRDYMFEYSYDSNITELAYSWGADSIANRITVKGERYFPSISPVRIREVFVVNPGDTVISTKFSNIKQLDTEGGSLTQNQFDSFANQWREQATNHSIDIEFRNPLLGDTDRSRNAGKAIRIRAIPTTAPASWDEDSTAFDEIPTSEWVGIGWKVNWDEPGDTGPIANPNINSVEELNITGIAVDADGIRVTINHLDKSQRQFFIQLEVEGYTLTRTQRFTALHENFASMQKYFAKSFEISNRFISNMDIAKFRARRLSQFLSEERPDVRITTLGSPHIELEDVVAVREVNSGLAGDYFEVVGISDEVMQDRYLTHLKLRKICEITTDQLAQNDPVAGYAGGYIGKRALPIETFVNTDYNKP